MNDARAAAEPPQIMRLCRRIEALADADGWGAADDPRAAAFVLYLHDGSDLPDRLAALGGPQAPPVVSGRVAACSWIRPELFTTGVVAPPTAIVRSAFNTVYADAAQVDAVGGAGTGDKLLALREALRHPSIVGFAFRYEAWMITDIPRTAAAGLGPGRLRDHRQSVEGRLVTACDTAGRVYTVIRERGREPVMEIDPPEVIRGRGQVESAVRILADHAGGRSPHPLSTVYLHRYRDAPGTVGYGGENMGREWRPATAPGRAAHEPATPRGR